MIIILHGITPYEQQQFIKLFPTNQVHSDDEGSVHIHDQDKLLIVKIYNNGCIVLYPNKETVQVLGALRGVLP